MSKPPPNRNFFYLLLLFAVYVAYTLIKPYLGVIAISLILVVIFRPVYLRFVKWFKGRQTIAIILTTLSILVVVLIPAVLVINMTINQVVQFSQDIARWNLGETASLEDLVVEFNAVLDQVPQLKGLTPGLIPKEEEIVKGIRNVLSSVGSLLASSLLEVGFSTVDIITSFIVFISLLSVLFPMWPKVVEIFKNLSPLDDELDQTYVARMTAMTKAMVQGTLLLALMQGVVMGCLLWIAGIPYIFFWMLLATFLAILPVGASLLAFPIGIFLIVTGDIWQGLVVILGYIIVVANIDPIVRPRLVPKEAQFSPALTLLSLAGGVKLFGFLGVIYGPIIMVFLVTTTEIYLEHYNLSLKPKPTSGADGLPHH